MKLSETILEQSAVGFPISRFASPEQILFLDIETTGFTARSSYLYLIGCAYYQNGKWAIAFSQHCSDTPIKASMRS